MSFVAAVLVGLLAGCGSGPGTGGGGCDRVDDAIRLDGRTYRALPSSSVSGSALAETAIGVADLGTDVGVITTQTPRCTSLTDDAAYLLIVGSHVRAIDGYPAWFRVAVVAPQFDATVNTSVDEVRVYEQSPFNNPGRTPDEIVDLGHVRAIEAQDDSRGAKKLIEDLAVVAEFVKLLRAGTVGKIPGNGPSPSVSLRLGLDKGPPVFLAYWTHNARIDQISVDGRRMRDLLGIGPTFGD
jgi:hypothetical protein